MLIQGDCLVVLKTLADNSIDAVVTDPPYHLTSIVKRFGGDNAAPAQYGTDGAFARASRGFMGKQWDGGDIAFRVELWSEVLRVLKPGGHLAAFSGTRTYHRMACAIEDAGFEVRDQLAWTYGSGFPKSLDISKAIDKAAGAEREVVGRKQFADGTFARETQMLGGNATFSDPISRASNLSVTAPATDAARQWEGWGTALKPAWECIALARKPLSEKTVAANVLRWGTGAINVDATRIGTEGATKRGAQVPYGPEGRMDQGGGQAWRQGGEIVSLPLGRWPANLCHDGSQEVLDLFPESKSQSGGHRGSSQIWGSSHGEQDRNGFDDSGSAARFFYCAKASKADRAGSSHPTVKPVKLMQWLCRMLCPPNGTILDPFAGSGTTGQAAINEGFRYTMVERESEYINDIEKRLSITAEQPTPAMAAE